MGSYRNEDGSVDLATWKKRKDKKCEVLIESVVLN